MTHSILLGMDSTKFVVKVLSSFMRFQTLWTCWTRASRVLSSPDRHSLTIPPSKKHIVKMHSILPTKYYLLHTFSIGFKSGEQDGQSMSCTSGCSSNYFMVLAEVCTGALSCIKVITGYSSSGNRARAQGSMTSSKIFT